MTTDEKQPAVIGSLKRFKVAGFRRLVDVDVELGPLNILIGSNGCGKTSFLDAIEMMARTLKRDLKSFIAELGGFGQIVSSGLQAKGIEIQADLIHPEAQVHYSLKVDSHGYGHSVKAESLEMTFSDQNREEGYKLSHKFPSNSLVAEARQPIEEAPSNYWVGDADFKLISLLRNTINISSISTARRAPARSPQRLSPVMWHTTDASDLFIRLLDIQQRDPERYQSILEVLKIAFPSFERLELQIVGDGYIGLYWHEVHLKQPLGAGQLSDGILRFLWLLSVLYHPDCPAVVLFDEPESHFHPQLIQIMIAVFRECSSWTQIIATTHSPTIVRFIKPEELLVMDMNENGLATIQRASNLNLAHWLEDFNLDEIWSMGRLTEQA